jgi:hypothetical protein
MQAAVGTCLLQIIIDSAEVHKWYTHCNGLIGTGVAVYGAGALSATSTLILHALQEDTSSKDMEDVAQRCEPPTSRGVTPLETLCCVADSPQHTSSRVPPFSI